jgi:hypothetical protein
MHKSCNLNIKVTEFLLKKNYLEIAGKALALLVQVSAS